MAALGTSVDLYAEEKELEKYVLPLYLEPVNRTNSRIKYRNSLLNFKKKYYNGMGREKNLPMFFCAQDPQMEVCCGAE